MQSRKWKNQCSLSLFAHAAAKRQPLSHAERHAKFWGKEHEEGPRESSGVYCIKLENNSPEETPESPGDLLTHMEHCISLGDERKVKEAEQDNKAHHFEEGLSAQLYVS